ncbi:hypothetical protein MKX03_021341 [Papaver bracteatum]|nr:hypothetical protein MKX03_021341 [Papaver bracteatum]
MEKRLFEVSNNILDFCRKKLSCKDSRLDNLDEVFTCFRRTPLHIAVMSNDIKFAKQILSLKPDLALKQDNLGWTPLHLASARASLQMVELLVSAEPSACEAKDDAQRTPLHLAAMNNRVEIMEVLTEEGLPKVIHLKNDQNGETILHFCVKSNSSIEIFELLVDKLALARTSNPNIIVNSKDNSGITMVQYILQSSKLKLEITDADFAEALNELSPEKKNDLETRFQKKNDLETRFRKNDLEINTSSKNVDKHKWLKQRVNALMVVATLIAGIAFQAAMNPPGGVWQDNTRVNSNTDPVAFAYYLDAMFRSSVSGGLIRYLKKYSKGGNILTLEFLWILLCVLVPITVIYSKWHKRV